MNEDLRAELERLLSDYSMPEFMTELMIITTQMQTVYDPDMSVADREALSRFCSSIAKASRFCKEVERFTSA